MTLTRALREELARRSEDPPEERDAEVATALRCGGAWFRRGGDSQEGTGSGWVFASAIAAAARRVRASVAAHAHEPPAVEVQRPGGLIREARWRVVVEDRAALTALGLTDDQGRPQPGGLPSGQAARLAALRGALLGAATLSDPGRSPNLDLRAPGEALAADLVDALAAIDVDAAHGAHGDAWRVTVRSGAGIARLLVQVGAYGTFLSFDEGRLRRELRADANRAANAERANLGRAVSASSRQTEAIAQLLADGALDDLSQELRDVALARLANPGVSLAELARLVGVGRATVHRRLARLEQVAAERGSTDRLPEGPSGREPPDVVG
ncbi:DNA-binding protein WhiA [Egibacter rhizosphaerae]|nr:DNA-binding protein WhiA [Egibacter rhizosphaerae]